MMPHLVRLAALPAACALCAGAASAADLPNAPQNYPALATSPAEPEWNPWSGLYVGTGISAWGGKGIKGGVGGEGYLGYDHAFDNGVVVGVRASSGYEPFLWSTPRGFTQFTGTAFAGGEAIVGYQMGQVTPYVIAGVDLARPTRFGSAQPARRGQHRLLGARRGRGGRHGRPRRHLPHHQQFQRRRRGDRAHARARRLAPGPISRPRLISPDAGLRPRVAFVSDLMTLMAELTRRVLIAGAAASWARFVAPAAAQTDAPQGGPVQAPFGYQDVVKRAHDLAAAPYDATVPPLPDGLANLDFDAWRDIRFKSDKPLLGQQLNATFRLELFHLGHLYKRPVVVNVLRDGIPAPIPYATNLFDYGRTKVDGNLPINLGFAGFRLRFPLNAPHVWDEVVAFLGASYFRFLGRGQRYGLSARGLAVGGGRAAQRGVSLLPRVLDRDAGPDRRARSSSTRCSTASWSTGAFRFDLVPGQETTIEANVTLFARKAVPALGLAPLSSMFFVGKNDHRFADDFRGELHDSDGLLMHTGAGEWIWRPLSNPVNPRSLGVSRFEPARLRALAARPQFQRLPGPRTRL